MGNLDSDAGLEASAMEERPPEEPSSSTAEHSGTLTKCDGDDGVREELEPTRGQGSNAVVVAEEKLRLKEKELDNVRTAYKETEDRLSKECIDVKVELDRIKTLKAEAEDALKIKDRELHRLIAEHEQTENRLIQERDDAKQELESTMADLRKKLEAATEKLSQKEAELDSLKMEHKQTIEKLIKECVEVRAELWRTQLELECMRANLLGKEELNKAKVDIACKDAQLEHATASNAEVQCLQAKLQSETMRRVESETRLELLSKENAELRRKQEEFDADQQKKLKLLDEQLLREHFNLREDAHDNKAKKLHPGNYCVNKMKQFSVPSAKILP